MGLVFNDVLNLLEWRQDNIGGSVVTLGRQGLSLHPSDIAALRRTRSDSRSLAWLNRYKWGDYADDMFRELFKFDIVESIDFSDYEGATIVQNIGEPLKNGLAGGFDLVIDGGTLEHVFNVPVAFSNLMSLCKVGGAAYTHSPCNSMSGHGFYQFSAELMFRIFSKQNGFEVRFVRIAVGKNLSVEQTTDNPVYEVKDPAAYGGRVNLTGSAPTILNCLAVKVDDVEPFAHPVLQSDYVEKWSSDGGPSLNWKGRLIESVGKTFPALPTLISRHRDRREASVANNRAYRRIR
jgi:hypothetical protein